MDFELSNDSLKAVLQRHTSTRSGKQQAVKDKLSKYDSEADKTEP